MDWGGVIVGFWRLDWHWKSSFHLSLHQSCEKRVNKNEALPATLAAAADQFKTTRAGVIEFLEQYTDDLRASEVKHPHPAAGMVSICEMLTAVAMHAKRHAAQIEEIRNRLDLK